MKNCRFQPVIHDWINEITSIFNSQTSSRKLGTHPRFINASKTNIKQRMNWGVEGQVLLFDVRNIFNSKIDFIPFRTPQNNNLL